jgi:hypothetical protein
MSSGARLVLAVVLSAVVLVASSVGLAVAAAYYPGTVRVEVEDHRHGDHVDVHVPAGLIDLAVALVPEEAFRDLERELPAEGEAVLRAVRSAGKELERLPDTVFVEYRSADEHVVIEKRGRRYVVRFDSDSERVEIAVPVRTVNRLLRKLPA